MKSTYLVQEGIWSPRDGFHVWRTVAETATGREALLLANAMDNVRIVMCRITYERTAERQP